MKCVAKRYEVEAVQWTTFNLEQVLEFLRDTDAFIRYESAPAGENVRHVSLKINAEPITADQWLVDDNGVVVIYDEDEFHERFEKAHY